MKKLLLMTLVASAFGTGMAPENKREILFNAFINGLENQAFGNEMAREYKSFTSEDEEPIELVTTIKGNLYTASNVPYGVMITSMSDTKVIFHLKVGGGFLDSYYYLCDAKYQLGTSQELENFKAGSCERYRSH